MVPETRYHEIKEFVKRGLQDFSISRLKSKMPWGVPVPGDEEHVMYVWFDALVNYISTLGWPNKSVEFDAFWPGVQIAGKDNLRQQAAMWQAMLMSADVPNSRQVLIHGFITSNGQKMSKSLGNVVGPYEIVEKCGVDALRYWLLREANMFEDSDFTWEKFKESYNANLANGLGNLVSRVTKMAQQYFSGRIEENSEPFILFGEFDNVTMNLEENLEKNKYPIQSLKEHRGSEYDYAMENFKLQNAMSEIWRIITDLDEYIAGSEPFKIVKENPKKTEGILWNTLWGISYIANLLVPFMPQTSQKIRDSIGCVVDSNNEPISFQTKVLEENLFPRIQ